MATDILAFCQARDIPTDGIKVFQKVDWHRKNTSDTKIAISVSLPPEFPDKYVKAVKNFAKICLVSKLGIGLKPESWFTPEVEKRQG
jgi:putative redox protein